MKKITILILAIIFSQTLLADRVNPGGSDEWKVLNVEIYQFDRRTLPNSNLESRLWIELDDKSINVDTKDIEERGSQMVTLRVPARNKGKFSINYRLGSYSYRNLLTLASGTIETKVHNELVVLKRLDVNHMLVTRENGTQYYAEDGTVSLSYKNTHDEEFDYLDSYPTGYGIDVPMGFIFGVYVKAKTEDGEDEYSQVLDFTDIPTIETENTGIWPFPH